MKTKQSIVEFINKVISEEDLKISAIDFVDLEDSILNKIPNNLFYHGSNDITWFNNINDIDTLNNTKNAQSKYLFLSPNKRVALNYSVNSIGLDRIIKSKSGIIVFSLKKSKYKKLTGKDYDGVLNYDDMEKIWDEYKNLGYDYLINTYDANNHIILNPNILVYKNKYYNLPI